MKLLTSTSLVLATAIALFSPTATAFPSGAGGCAGGQAAVGGSHLESQVVETGTLEEQNVELLINGVLLQSDGNAMNIPVGVDHTWELRTSGVNTTGFRGYLMRLDGGSPAIDTSDTLQPIPGQAGRVQVADTVCIGVGSVTHRSRVLINSVSGYLRLDEVSTNLDLDVTIVFQNTNGLSKYSYSPFLLTAVDEGATGDEVVEEEESDVAQEEVLVQDDLVVGNGIVEATSVPTEQEEIVEEVVVEATASPTKAATGAPTTSPTVPISDGDDDDDDDDDAEDSTQQTSTLDPTKISTDQPTTMPVPAPVEIAGDEDDEDASPTLAPVSTITMPLLTVVRPSCNENNTCTMCAGDCDSDADCRGDLACFQRDEFDLTEVPGCSGKGTMGRDYCYDPKKYPNALRLYDEDCSEENPCEKCEGDCDDDSHCTGSLECFQRRDGSNETVPGCYGVGYPSRDYCFDRQDMDVIGMEPGVTEEEVLEEAAAEMEEPEEEETLEVPDVAVNAQENLALTEGSCSSMNPCGECIGDCDYDNQCDGEDLECYPRRVGDISPVPGCNGDGYAGWDYCYKPPKDLLRPRVVPCTSLNPCLKCQADCDNDNDCEGDLKCFFRDDGAEDAVPGCTGTPTGGLDYCYDPSDERRALRRRS